MIEGNITNLRAREPGDAQRIHVWLNDREVQRFMGGRYPWSLAAEVEWLRNAPRRRLRSATTVFASRRRTAATSAPPACTMSHPRTASA